MCKPLPGPRCAGHTGRKVQDKVHALNVSKKQLVRLEASLANVPDEKIADYVQEVQAAYVDVEWHEQELLEAKRQYWTTPEGQKELEAEIEKAGTPSQQAVLTKELDTAREHRNTQMSMYRLLKAGKKNLDTLTPEQAEAFLERKKEIARVDAERSTVEGELREVIQSVKDAPADSTNQLRSVLGEDVRGTHTKLARLIRDAYVEHGVARETANHYAKDAIESMRGDVAGHLTADGQRPVYTLKDDFELKEKSPLTRDATAAIQSSPEIAKAHQEVVASHAVYNELVPQTLQTRRVRQDLHAAVDETEAKLTELTEKSKQLRQRDTHLQAVASRWGSETPRLYEVDKGVFIKSSYANPDGSTNAYVLVPSFAKSVGPMYVQVTGVEENAGRKVVTLENGDRITGEEANHVKFVLVKPLEGARALFDNS